MAFFKKKPDNSSENIESVAPLVHNDDEIVAAISAAVLAYLGDGFKISSITESGTVRPLRVGEQNNPWVQYSRMRNVRV